MGMTKATAAFLVLDAGTRNVFGVVTVDVPVANDHGVLRTRARHAGETDYLAVKDQLDEAVQEGWDLDPATVLFVELEFGLHTTPWEEERT